MAEIDNDVAEYFQCLAGTENDLSTFVDSEHEIKYLCDSRYIELSDIKSVIKIDGEEFIVLSFNIQSINAKFVQLWIIYLQWACTSVPYVSRRPGFHLMPMFYCYISPAIS